MPETANDRESSAESTRNGARKSFTGRARRHRNRWSVRVADATARWLITIGGVGTIVAVLLVFAFLLSVVLPLFWPPPSVALQGEFAAPWSERPLATGVNEYRSLAWALLPNGHLVVYRADTGERLEDREFCVEGRITAVSAAIESGRMILGFADGTIRLGRIHFTTSFADPANLPDEFRNLPDDAPRNFEAGLLQRTPQGQLRVQMVESALEEPLEFASGAVRMLDQVSIGDDTGESLEPVVAGWIEGGRLALATTRRNELTERHKIEERSELVLEGSARSTPPVAVLLSARGNELFLAAATGDVARYRTSDPARMDWIATTNVLDSTSATRASGGAATDAGLATLTSCQWVLGRETLLCGDSAGRLSAWFLARTTGGARSATTKGEETQPETAQSGATNAGPTNAGTADERQLVRAHTLAAGPAAVTSLSRSQRGRLAVAGFADGSFAVHHVTTENRLLEQGSRRDSPVVSAALTPKDDGLVVIDATGRVARYAFEPRHPEVSWAALFRPVWYEGYDRPEHVWQSSFAGIEPEMKLGLWPLVSGTLKATFYSMVLGVPIALLAAIYTSEFMSPRLRAKVKPAIEMMASLPSVVLGFLAALVFAPVVEQTVPEVLTSLVTVPMCFLIGAALWQLAPTEWGPYMAPYRFLGIAAAFAVGLAAAWLGGSLVERWLFAGDIMSWLDGQIGDGSAAWLIVLLPTLAVLAALVVTAWVNPWLRRRWGDWSRPAFGLLNLIKIGVMTVLTFGLAWGMAELLTAVGWDLRGTIVSTYVQRNALVVGFVMGFAIIPIIYTIADDALSTVPQHLRSASLGAGATPWQTAVRVVIPTAMSGLFSALMIGLGRAVGETMIVLMAGGNTPVTDWNVFSGFRTLSANIAVELPEAVRDSTHYRTLFLAALTLFVLTFVVNTAAEIVRTRFRRRAVQL